MKKNTIRRWAALAVMLAVYHVVIFALPFPKTPVFFLSWGFTLAAVAVLAWAVHAAFVQGGDVKSKFYGFPIVRLGAIYLAVQLVLGLVFMALGGAAPVQLPLVLYAILLAAAALGLIAAGAARDEVVRQDAGLVKDTARMRALQGQAKDLPGLTQDPALRRELNDLAEALRYSDPVSAPALEDAEAGLAAVLDQLRQAVEGGDAASASALCQSAQAALAQRNRLCRQSKGR